MQRRAKQHVDDDAEPSKPKKPRMDEDAFSSDEEPTPPDTLSKDELAKIPGLGPKTLKLVRSELGVEDLDGLKEAIEHAVYMPKADQLTRMQRMRAAVAHNTSARWAATFLEELENR